MTPTPARSRIREMLMVAALVAGAGCATTNGAGQPSSLGGIDWRLVDLRGQAALPAEVTRRPWLRFQTDSARVVGSAGCNRLSGPFTLTGHSLSFGAIVSTKMACADQSLNQQEQEFFAALQATDRFEVSGDTLVLRRAGDPLARLVH